MSIDSKYTDFIFIIYSCKKNLKQANTLYNRFLAKFTDVLKIKTFVIYGDKPEFLSSDKNKNKKQYILRDNTIILNVEDDYKSLNKKTAETFKTVSTIFPNAKGCFKCDDDIFINMNSLLKLKKYIDYSLSLRQPIDYIGQIVFTSIMSEYDTYDDGNDIYCGGPMYYLSHRSMSFIKRATEKDIIHYEAEDRMVGHILKQNQIVPTYYKLYDDDISQIAAYSFHNKKHKNTVFQLIKGGLGNQLFQIISGYATAVKNNMNFLIVDTTENFKHHFKHTNDNSYILKTIFKHFTSIFYDKIAIETIPYYKEKDEDCFQYTDLKIDNNDILLDGYFQNEKYFKFCKNEILSKLISHNEYYNFFPLIFRENAEVYKTKTKDSYFIHIRRGDYVNHPLYKIDYDKYFKSAINMILEMDPDAFFFIISDDIAFCKKYHVLNNINKEFINLGDIETLYFMSYCYKGGICSNSTFSWWGSYLNENPQKVATFPSSWMNNNWTNDIYYEDSIIINC
jgi:hypothetical protein